MALRNQQSAVHEMPASVAPPPAAGTVHLLPSARSTAVPTAIAVLFHPDALTNDPFVDPTDTPTTRPLLVRLAERVAADVFPAEAGYAVTASSLGVVIAADDRDRAMPALFAEFRHVLTTHMHRGVGHPHPVVSFGHPHQPLNLDLYAHLVFHSPGSSHSLTDTATAAAAKAALTAPWVR